MNIDKYLYNTTTTEQGYVYKNKLTFLSCWDSICYIPEGGIDTLQELKKEGKDLEDKDILRQSIGFSRNGIRDEIIDTLLKTSKDIDKDHLDNIIFDLLDWQTPSSLLLEWDEISN